MRRLTEEQELAVSRRSEPLLLSAAAGSGKTSVLVERFVRAIREDGIAPGRILAITFTERAAGELRDRVRASLLALGEREAARDTEAAFVGTFHGFCARLLRTHPLAAGLDPDFQILDEGLAGRMRERAFKSALRGFLGGERGEAVELLAAYGVDRIATMVEQVHRELRSRGQRMPRLPDPGPQEEESQCEAARACALLGELLGRFGAEYEAIKRRRGAVDFDDLELLTGELLGGRYGLRAVWAERFELLMVDEFQDTNPRQLAILEALDRDNLFTVGDELQSIYGFRHADVTLFRARRQQLGGRGAALALTRNFRSADPVIEVVNTVFAARFDGYAALVGARAEAQAAVMGEGPAGGGAGAEVELLLTNTRGWEERADLAAAVAAGLPRTQLWRQAEARMLARRVAELVAAGEVRPGDVAVLLRATGDLEVFERALQLCGLRTLAAVGAFWNHQQITDLISYLRALANPLDGQALYEALASPLCGCSRDALAHLADGAREAGETAWATALRAAQGEGAPWVDRLAQEDRERLGAFCLQLSSERAQAPRRGLSELIDRAVRGFGYDLHVSELEWGERRMANVHKLLRLARRFEAGEGRDLRGFLDHVAHLQRSEAVEPDAPVEGVEPDAVRLMSIHAAKGLEFPVVCLADLGRQPSIRVPDLLVDADRIGLRLARLDGERASPALEFDQLSQERREREAQEEDRILYVAMTRARDRLLLSGAVDFERWPASRSAPTPISWVGPALVEGLPERLLAAAPGEQELGGGPAGGGVRCRLNDPANAAWMLAGVRSTPRPGGAIPPAPASPRGLSERGDRRAVPTDRLASLSYTSLSELERCGYRYYLERVLGLAQERPPRPPSGAGQGGRGGSDPDPRARGTLVHALMEGLDFARPRPPQAAEVQRMAAEIGTPLGEEDARAIADLIARSTGAPLARRAGGAATVRREHPFAFSLDGESVISGIIDLLAREDDGGYLVVDYKSDRVGPADDLSELVEREYGLQRLVYALAVLRGEGEAVEIVHWFLERPEEPVAVRFTAADRPGLEEELAERVARARARGYAVSRDPHRGLCLTCPGRAGLCSWGEAETLRPGVGDDVMATEPPEGPFEGS